MAGREARRDMANRRPQPKPEAAMLAQVRD